LQALSEAQLRRLSRMRQERKAQAEKKLTEATRAAVAPENYSRTKLQFAEGEKATAEPSKLRQEFRCIASNRLIFGMFLTITIPPVESYGAIWPVLGRRRDPASVV
jgi:hypothetical protein